MYKRTVPYCTGLHCAVRACCVTVTVPGCVAARCGAASCTLLFYDTLCGYEFLTRIQTVRSIRLLSKAFRLSSFFYSRFSSLFDFMRPKSRVDFKAPWWSYGRQEG